MSTRFTDALMIQEGACNPAGIARSLVKACDECLAENVQQRTDPAVRLIVHQLASLCNIWQIDNTSDEYSRLTKACRDGDNIQAALLARRPRHDM